MAADRDPRAFHEGTYVRRVVGDELTRILAADPALAVCSTITSAQVAGLLAALRDYAPCAELLRHHVARRASCDEREFFEYQRHWLALANGVYSIGRRGAVKRELRWRLGADGERRVFTAEEQAWVTSFKYTSGMDDLSLGELCHLLSVLHRYALVAMPVGPMPLPIEPAARAAHAHNQLLAVSETPFTIADFGHWVQRVEGEVLRLRVPRRFTAIVDHEDKTAIPDFLEPLTGWRAWMVVRDGFELRLSSMVRKATWTPYAPMVARHQGPRPCADGTPCSCGIYAFKRPEPLLRDLRVSYRHQRSSTSWVVGAVRLWGRFAEHEHGWRAQFAYPDRLIYGHNCDAQRVAALYGITYQEDVSWTSALKSALALQNRCDPPFPTHPRVMRTIVLPSRPVSRRPTSPCRWRTDQNPELYATLTFSTGHRVYDPWLRLCDAGVAAWHGTVQLVRHVAAVAASRRVRG